MDNLQRFLINELPDTSTLSHVDAGDILTKYDSDKFYVYRGIISRLSSEVRRVYGPSKGDAYKPVTFYEAILQDSTGEVRLHSPWIRSDDKDIHDQLKNAHKSKHPIQVVVYLFHGAAINKEGWIDRKVNKLYHYPVEIQQIDDNPESFEPATSSPLLSINRIRQVGKNWQFTFEGRQTDYKGGAGFIYLKELLLNPNRKINAADLRVLTKGPVETWDQNPIEKSFDEDDGYTPGVYENDIVSRRKTIDNYQKELIKNHKARQIAEANNDTKTISDLDKATEFIAAELKKLTGRGYERTIGFEMSKKKADQEAVSNAIGRAFIKINEKEPDLVVYLRGHLTRSYTCEFIVDLDHEAPWES